MAGDAGKSFFQELWKIQDVRVWELGSAGVREFQLL